MKGLLFKVALLCLIFAGNLYFPTFLHPEEPRKKAAKTERAPIVIKADTLEIDDKKKVIIFSDNVEAKEQEFILNCKTMSVYYLEEPGAKSSENGELKINKIVAKGGVRITRTAGGLATADQALYYHADEKLVLTGKPVVKQGNDFVEGSKITLFIRENRSIVEGSSEKKVRAVLFPSRKEGSRFGP